MEVDISTLSVQELLDLKNALERLEKVEEMAGIDKWFVDGTEFSIENYPKHKMYFDSGIKYRERVFLCGNRVGKSQAGGFEVACHLTGKYPSWWKGRRFSHPIDVWVAGKDKITTRDTIQHILLGGVGHFGTGTIPAKDIIRTWSMQGVPNGVELAQVQHISGGVSTIGFKSYDRGVDSFFGTARHLIWLDEECPNDVYNECLYRTMTTQGMVMTTFTPLKGLTPLILHLCSKADFLSGEPFVEQDEDNASASRCVVMASWDDAPHLDEKAKKELLDSTPPYLREARSKGVPQIGEGTIYPVLRSEIEVDPFEIPAHYKRWYACDVGWNCTAALFFAKDPDTGTVYVTHEYKGERAEPLIHAQAIKNLGGTWMVGAIDPASHNRSQVDGSKLINIYRAYGLKLVHANNAVETGIAKCWEGFSTGSVKVFRNLNKFYSELMVYRRENGQIKKENDHLMDCFRYGINTDQIASNRPTSTSGVGSYSMKVPF